MLCICFQHFPNGVVDPMPAICPAHTSTSTRKRPADRKNLQSHPKKPKQSLQFYETKENIQSTSNTCTYLPLFHDLCPSDTPNTPDNCTNVKDHATQTVNTSNDFINFVLSRDLTCFQYTGIPTVSLLNWLFQWILPAAQHIKLWDGKYKTVPRNSKTKGRKRKTDFLFIEMLLCLVKIRMGFGHKHLSFLFGLSTSHVSRIFISWTNLLHQCLKALLIWPSKEIVKTNLPLSFSKYPNTRCIIDCTEYYVQKPLRPAAQKASWSNYKHSNTFKQLVGISPNGTITFLSNIYGGSISDAKIVQVSGFIEHVEQGDDIMADRGFNIRHLLLPKKATLNIPAFSHGKCLSTKAVKRSRSIASVRIHVERAIRRMKTFKILSGIIPLKYRFLLHQITTIVAVLCNMQPCLA